MESWGSTSMLEDDGLKLMDAKGRKGYCGADNPGHVKELQEEHCWRQVPWFTNTMDRCINPYVALATGSHHVLYLAFGEDNYIHISLSLRSKAYAL